MMACMVAAAVGVGVLAIWLTTGRVQFTWRISWLAAGFAVICASSLAAGGKLSGWISGGIFEVIRGVVRFLLKVLRLHLATRCRLRPRPALPG
jgi:hypothetical protein